MLRYAMIQAVTVTVAISMVVSEPLRVSADETSSWSEWRGPNANGVALNAKPPIEWGTEKNVRWRTAIPGRGHSTPVAFGDRIFLTTAIPIGAKLSPRMSGRPGEHDAVRSLNATLRRVTLFFDALPKRLDASPWSNRKRLAWSDSFRFLG